MMMGRYVTTCVHLQERDDLAGSADSGVQFGNLSPEALLRTARSLAQDKHTMQKVIGNLEAKLERVTAQVERVTAQAKAEDKLNRLMEGTEGEAGEEARELLLSVEAVNKMFENHGS